MDSATIMNVYNYGTYYNPASKHYGGDHMTVNCDRCSRTNLKTCIGWQKFDLCNACISDIEKTVPRFSDLKPGSYIPFFPEGEIKTLMMQPQFDTTTITKMSQSQFDTTSRTRMSQSQFDI
jgi:hypothetical protein